MIKLVELARELHITPQAIYKRKASDFELSEAIDKGTTRRGKLSFLDEQAEQAIRRAFADSIGQQTASIPDAGLVEFLRAQLAEKDRQLAEKDTQIAMLHTLLNQQQQLNLKTQMLLEPPKHRTIWERLRLTGDTEKG